MGFRNPTVTLPASQLTPGAVPAGVTLPAAQLTAGAIPSGVTLTADGVTGGTLGGTYTITGAIETAPTGARVEISSAGIAAYNAAGTQTVAIASADGSVALLGTLASGTSGQHAVVGSGATGLLSPYSTALALYSGIAGEAYPGGIGVDPTTGRVGLFSAGIGSGASDLILGVNGGTTNLNANGPLEIDAPGSTVTFGPALSPANVLMYGALHVGGTLIVDSEMTASTGALNLDHGAYSGTLSRLSMVEGGTEIWRVQSVYGYPDLYVTDTISGQHILQLHPATSGGGAWLNGPLTVGGQTILNNGARALSCAVGSTTRIVNAGSTVVTTNGSGDVGIPTGLSSWDVAVAWNGDGVARAACEVAKTGTTATSFNVRWWTAAGAIVTGSATRTDWMVIGQV